MTAGSEWLQGLADVPWSGLAAGFIFALYLGVRLAVVILRWSDRRRQRGDLARMRAAATRGERER